ncbi:hypothetical protein HDA42_005645 [Streptomyces costaricanus]|uniref:Uncharacterized protein n=1 Tax=Streptomyces murinus TaxID=33900 RepID=A0A7W3NTP5_STRMR|nr:hypothetical protein [Streptomyces murinus]
MPIKAEPNRIKAIKVIKVESNRIKAESNRTGPGRIEPTRPGSP